MNQKLNYGIWFTNNLSLLFYLISFTQIFPSLFLAHLFPFPFFISVPFLRKSLYYSAFLPAPKSYKNYSSDSPHLYFLISPPHHQIIILQAKQTNYTTTNPLTNRKRNLSYRAHISQFQIVYSYHQISPHSIGIWWRRD